MTDFVAIDFETANNKRSSICSIGLVVVRSGEVVHRVHRLVCPAPNYYCQWSTKVHGVTGEDTYDAPDFPYVWAEIAPLVEGLPLVAHNAAFDEGCLRAAHELYGMPYPNYEFYCTYRAARHRLPGLENHKLNTVAVAIGHDLERHHHALDDAEACAAIAVSIM